MKKVLIFLERNLIRPGGGPYGYNYNLLKGLDGCRGGEIKIYTLEESLEKKYLLRPKLINGVLKKLFFFSRYCDNDMKKFYSYDAIHFHTSSQMYRARHFLKNYSGKVLFTSHSPMLLSREMREDASTLSKIVFFWFYALLKRVDRYAFGRADYIFFPCKEAEDPYEKESVYKKARREKKFKYLLTGVQDCRKKVRKTKEEFRRELGIPKDAVLISYIGRHNTVKGYSDLKSVAEEIMRRNVNVYFVIGGKESPMSGLENERWIEMGYIDDPYSLINACDIFVLPNRQTYFDLVFLEVLSLGKRIVASYTGGNCYFKRYKSDDIIFYNRGELRNAISGVLDREDKKCHAQDNREIYLKDFTCEKFAERYLKSLSEIL